MSVVKWDESLCVQINTIDNQHKILINIINEFYENIKLKSNKALIADLIKKMKAYTLLHFSEEEKIFATYKYPEFDLHKKEHQEFIDKVNDLEKRFNDGKLILSFEITSFLKNWLITHIQGSDMRYSKYLLERGVK